MDVTARRSACPADSAALCAPGDVRVLSRDELYALVVWAEPLLAVAKRFKFSENGLQERCKAMKVPTPSVGYWPRVEHGHKPRRPRLPQLKGEVAP
jgi:hypothetical protein